MNPREIGRLTRAYALSVLFWPRDEGGGLEDIDGVTEGGEDGIGRWRRLMGFRDVPRGVASGG